MKFNNKEIEVDNPNIKIEIKEGSQHSISVKLFSDDGTVTCIKSKDEDGERKVLKKTLPNRSYCMKCLCKVNFPQQRLQGKNQQNRNLNKKLSDTDSCSSHSEHSLLAQKTEQKKLKNRQNSNLSRKKQGFCEVIKVKEPKKLTSAGNKVGKRCEKRCECLNSPYIIHSEEQLLPNDCAFTESCTIHKELRNGEKFCGRKKSTIRKKGRE